MASKNEITDLKRDMPKYPNQQLVFSVPVAPSVNHMYIRTGKGQTLTENARKYIKVVQNLCRDAIKKCKWKSESESVWYHMDLYFYFPDRRIRDSHNCIKLLLDCLQGLAFKNDYYVMPRIQFVGYSKHDPKIDIILKASTDE